MQNFLTFLFTRHSIKSNYIIILSALYFATLINYPVIKEIFKLSSDVPDWWFPYTAPFLLFFLFVLVFCFLCIPYVFKPVMTILIMTSAVVLYASVNYHVLFDYSMMENIFETNLGESSSYINVNSTLYFTLFGLLPSILLIYTKINYNSMGKELLSRLILVAFATAGLVLIITTTYKDYASVGRNNKYLSKMIIPAHLHYAYKYLKRNYFTQPIKYVSLGDDAYLEPLTNNKPTLTVFVLGETARADNFSLQYKRNTRPYTRDMNLIEFNQVKSCGTYTALSVPCMFSDFDRTNYNKAEANARDNVVDIIRKSGIETIWVENDGGDKGVGKNAYLIKVDPKVDDDLCNGETCYDEVMFKYLEPVFNSNKQDKFIVLHTIGSHGPTYFQRFPKDKATFSPWCERKDIENCTDEEIINVYDNTIVYTDYFLFQLIKRLQELSSDYNVAMMYMSDHGESLGENGLYLHGAPYAIAPDNQKTVPWIMWIPEQYAQQKNIDLECLRQESLKDSYSQDNLFDSLLGFHNIKTNDKNDKNDIFSLCQLTLN